MGSDRRDTNLERGLPDPEDLLLVKRALAGDREAFDAITCRHYLAVSRWIVRMLGVDNAPDRIQETFLKAWKSLDKYQPTHSLQAWIIRIANNTAIDFVRSKESRPWLELEDRQSDEELPDRLLEGKQLQEMWPSLKDSLLKWAERYMSSVRQQNARRAVAMLLDGYRNNWPAIARECGYKNGESARVSVTNQVLKALNSDNALEAARAVQELIERAFSREPGSLRFLGLVELRKK